jgi:solute carrier family 10 (sodium/bile acid cotransporter), member 7
MDLILPETAVGFDLTDTFIKLSLQVLFPVIIGLFVHPYLIKFVNKHQVALKNFDQAIILLIVFTAFAESFAENMFEGHSAGELIWLGVLMLGFFFLMMGLMYMVSRFFNFYQRRHDHVGFLWK